MGRATRISLGLIAVIAIGCETAPTPTPSGQSQATAPPSSADSAVATTRPGATLAPGEPGEPSSQALIAADLASGAITEAQALQLRAWALFWDPRLPERYDGAGSAGEDQGLFPAIEAILPMLQGGQRAELESYLLRPTDPRSAFNAGGSAAGAGGSGASLAEAQLAAASPPPPNLCPLAADWYFDEWSPNGDPNTGLRVWACEIDQATAQPDLDAVLNFGAVLWPEMTKPVPAGMGLPVPDTRSPSNDGNGKIDVYLLDAVAECRPRGNVCKQIAGDAGAMTSRGRPSLCGVPGFPANACTGYMLIPRSLTSSAVLAATLAHEFFHVLQFAHNAEVDSHWYEEASAAWAEWQYVATSGLFPPAEEEAATNAVYSWFRDYQTHRESLLRYLEDLSGSAAYQYEAWGWALFQSVEYGPQNVFETWTAIERAATVQDVNAAVNRVGNLETRFRDFAVRNAQTKDSRTPVVDEMPDDRWRNKPKLSDFPDAEHRPSLALATLPRGLSDHLLLTAALNAHYEPIEIRDDAIRQITIDISGLTNAQNADLDVIGLVQPDANSDHYTWRRFRPNGPKLVLCRDVPDQDVSFMVVVISNHARDYKDLGPDPAANLEGGFAIDAIDKCSVPDGFTGSISGTNGVDTWTGTATFDRVLPGDPQYACNERNEQTTYCYRLVGGQVTWTAAGASKVVSLAPSAATGYVQLIVADTRDPTHAGAYAILVAPSADVFMELGNGSRRYAQFTVFAWSQVIDFPRWPPDFTLAGTEDHSGCGIEGCGTQAWSWNLTAIFDPPASPGP